MEYQQIIDDYLRWIRNNTVAKTIEEGKVLALSTPFLDRHNDHVEIYLQRHNGNIRLTDDGYTLSDLSMSGFEVNTPKRESILRTTLAGFGVSMTQEGELFLEANTNNIGQKKHYFLQAILAVNDMFNLAQETVRSLFKEDVELYLRTNDIVFTQDVKLTGKSGFDHYVDFLIPSFRRRPERLVRALNAPKKASVSTLIFAFSDILETRTQETENYVVYNDVDNAVSNDVVAAFENYHIRPIPWSEKERMLEAFSMN